MQAEEQKRYEALSSLLKKLFGEGPCEFFSAPGRTELGGNHTDHNHGCVLAAAVNLDIAAAARRNCQNTVRVKSVGFDQTDVIALSSLEKRAEEAGSSAALIRGICARLRERGYKVGGFDAVTQSHVLKGAGLSSSAAFEVMIITVMSSLYNDGRISPLETAKIAQYAENEYFGKPCGLMDQCACAYGGAVFLDFADPENPLAEKLEFPMPEHALCIVDAGADHADLTGDYALIPEEMYEVARHFGKTVLREVSEAAFYREIPVLRRQMGDRPVLRAMHFFSENRRARAEADAIRNGAFDRFLSLVRESGKSSQTLLQNVFTGSAPQQQSLSVALALSERVLGARGACRVHGGGFAGTIQAFVPTELLPFYREELEAVFGKESCHVLEIRPAGGINISFNP